MKGQRGQGLVELALCAPIVILLTLATVAIVRVDDAAAGLEAATQAAASVAARASDSSNAVQDAERRFAAVVKLYPLRSPAVIVTVGDFLRSGEVSVASSAFVDLGWAAGLSRDVRLESRVVLHLDRWRSR